MRAASVGERQRETGRESAWLCLLGLRRSQTVRAPPPVEVEDSRPRCSRSRELPPAAPFPSVCARTLYTFGAAQRTLACPPPPPPPEDALFVGICWKHLRNSPARPSGAAPRDPARLGSARRGLEAAGAALGWAGADPGKSGGRTDSFNPQQQQLRVFSVSVQFACHLQNKSPITSAPVCQKRGSGEFGVSGGEKNS